MQNTVKGAERAWTLVAPTVDELPLRRLWTNASRRAAT
jgi:hypothetical protein